MNFTRREILFLSLIIAITIVIRLPHINRPISKHHEFNVGFFLQTMQIWNNSSAFDFNFVHVCNYQNINDKYITNLAFNKFQKDGTLYYASFPPFSYILPYMFFQIFQLEISILNLQIFNLILSAFFSIAVYLILKKISLRNHEYANLFSLVIWATLPAILWFHGNAYTHQVLFSVLLSFNILSFLYYKNKIAQVLFYLTLALCMYTDWAGFLLALSYFLCSIYQFFHTKRVNKNLLLIPLITVIVLGLIVWQFSAYIGFENYFSYMKMRFFTRSNISNISNVFLLPISLIKWLIIGFGFSFFLIIFHFIRNRFVSNQQSKSVIYILLLFGILFHFIFSNFTQIHDYSIIVNSVLLAILIREFLLIFSFKHQLIISIILFITNVVQYFYINMIGDIAQNGDRYDMYKVIGEEINSKTSNDEVIFITGQYIDNCPQLLWYAKRNYYYIEDTNYCSYLHKLQSRKIAIFNIQDNKIYHVEHQICP